MRSKERKDYYWRLAVKEGYRSRASFKLLEAVERYKFINPGDVVVDLGAFPGGWSQVARKFVGKEGFVLGVDIRPIKPFPWNNVKTIVADVREEGVSELIEKELPRKADVVLCDLSPKLSGSWELDHARQIDLVEKSLNIAKDILREGGNFFTKVFSGDLFDEILEKIKCLFTDVKILRPKAVRKRSAELYILALGMKKLKKESLMD